MRQVFRFRMPSPWMMALILANLTILVTNVDLWHTRDKVRDLQGQLAACRADR